MRSKLEQVRSKLSDEQATSLGGTLKEIEGAVQDLGSGHIAANSEAKNRKIEIRHLNEKLENIEIERDDYKTKYDSFDTSDLKKQIEEANKKITNMVSQQKDSPITRQIRFRAGLCDWAVASGNLATVHPSTERR